MVSMQGLTKLSVSEKGRSGQCVDKLDHGEIRVLQDTQLNVSGIIVQRSSINFYLIHDKKNTCSFVHASY